jgi:hypothetical protein
MVVASILALLSALVVPRGVGARADRGGSIHTPAAPTPTDSVTILRGAKHALRVFHTDYRYVADLSPPGRAQFTCEQTVWPYCFGPQNGRVPYGWPLAALPVQLPTNDPAMPRDLRRTIQGITEQVLRALDNAQKKLPGDHWLVGQRVFHRAGNGRFVSAREVADSCKAERWWCAALEGYMRVLQGDYPGADSAFSRSLSEQPADERCRWEDISDLVYGDPDRAWYTELTCDQRTQMNERLWWLADPLYMTPGNERRTAHYYRVVYARLFDDDRETLPPLGAGLGSMRPLITSRNGAMQGDPLYDRDLWDYRALLPLFRSLGTPAYLIISRVDPGESVFTRPDFLLQYPQPTYHFLPALDAVRTPMHATEDSWNPRSVDAQERYHPPFGIFVPIRAQVAFFRRGDSARVIAASDVTADTLVGRASLLGAALALTRGPADPPRIFHDFLPATGATFDVRAPHESTLVSIEALGAGVGAGRTRFASGPPPMPAQRVTLSDVLLLDTPDSLPETLDVAARLAATRPAVYRGDTLGIFWEMYGLNTGDTVSFSLSAVERSMPALTRVGRVLGLARDAMRPRLTWTDVITSGSAVIPRSVAIDLSGLGRGRYTLVLEARVPGLIPMMVRRDFEVIDF